MDTHLLALQLMAFQGILGALDTLYHHELTEALPQRSSARKELSIHAVRAIIYSILFIGLSAWAWHGVWAIVLIVLFSIEIILTLWDFVVEDKTRLLPPTERVMHTVLAINGGAFIALLALSMPSWYAGQNEWVWTPNGYLSLFLALCGIGVGLSGIRDAFAAFHLGKITGQEKEVASIVFPSSGETVLVTGATGFIGQHLVAKLIESGSNVVILTRNPKNAAWEFSGRVKCIGNMEELSASYSIDVIVNLAGARILGWRWTKRRKNVLRSSRVELTKSLVKWISKAKRKPRLLLSASAIGYYGIQEQGDDQELTELSKSQSIFMSQLCQEWEGAAQSAIKYGVQVKCMRFGLVLGRQGVLPMMILPNRLGLGGPLGGGQQWISWIHIHDLLRAMAHLWSSGSEEIDETGKFSVFNFTAPEAVKQINFSKIVGQVIRRPSVIPTPAFLLRLPLGEQSDLLLEGQRVLPVNLLAKKFEFSYPTLRSALSSLC